MIYWIFWIIVIVAVIGFVVLYLKSRRKEGGEKRVGVPPAPEPEEEKKEEGPPGV